MTRFVLLLTPVWFASGCALHAVRHDPAPPVEMTESFSVPASEALAPDRWWTAFGDDVLVSLADQALADNLQLKSMWARLAQAEAVGVSSQRWPQIDARLGTGRRRIAIAGQNPATGELDDFFIQANSASVSVAASYEVDLWRKIDYQVRAARFDQAATRDALESAAMTLTANVTESWFSVLHQRSLGTLLTGQLATNQRFLELVTLRFEQGLASALDVHQQQQQVANIKAQLALVVARRDTAGNQLAVLLGRMPRSLSLPEPGGLPALPALPSPGVPASLLTQRPDVRAAQRRLVASDYRLGAAIAARLPSIRLSGDASYQLSGLTGSFNPLWSLAAGLLQPIFDGGRLAAEVDRSEAVVEELLASFGQTLLQAALEVENALVLEAQQREHIAELKVGLVASQSALEQARHRYTEGLIDYLPVLNSLAAAQRTEQNVLNARRQLLSYRIQLYRALGGSWTESLSRTKPDPKKDQES